MYEFVNKIHKASIKSASLYHSGLLCWEVMRTLLKLVLIKFKNKLTPKMDYRYELLCLLSPRSKKKVRFFWKRNAVISRWETVSQSCSWPLQCGHSADLSLANTIVLIQVVLNYELLNIFGRKPSGLSVWFVNHSFNQSFRNEWMNEWMTSFTIYYSLLSSNPANQTSHAFNYRIADTIYRPG